MTGRIGLWVLGAVLLTGVCASKAEAQFISGGGYGLGFFNYGDRGYMERVPYYALYPPVYYSYPVARTYGYSPFAYPPGTMTPNAPAPSAAADFINPYVPRKDQPTVDRRDKTARISKPVRVAQTYVNPFVVQAEGASTQALTARVE